MENEELPNGVEWCDEYAIEMISKEDCEKFLICPAGFMHAMLPPHRLELITTGNQPKASEFSECDGMLEHYALDYKVIPEDAIRKTIAHYYK